MDDLTDRLTRLAERTAPPPREDLARAVVTRHRARRRQTIGLTAVAAAVAAVVVAVPVALRDPGDEAVPAVGVAAPGPVAASADVLTGPARGSLAGDAAFLEAVRALPWTDSPGDHAPDSPPVARRVVYAGDAAGRRWVLVAGEDPAMAGNRPVDPADPTAAGTLAAVWFTGPEGAAPEQLQRAGSMSGLAAGRPVALSDASTGALLVVAAPGDVVEVSRRPEVAADGTVSRDFVPVDAPDGVAALALGPATGSYDEALRYRVVRGGATVVTAMPLGWRPEDSAPPGPALAAAGTDPVLAGAVDHVFAVTGLRPDEVTLDVVWSGSLPGGDGPGTLRLLAATLPSGAVYLEATLTASAGTGAAASTWCATDLLPAGAPVTGRGFLLRCPEADDAVLLGPPGAATARVDGADVPLRDRVAAVPGDAAEVLFLAADGTVLAPAEELGLDGLERLAATHGWD
ncbi:hypothetical protein ACI79J_21960 [Geodermatophilus sp. SYSU D01062]